MTVVTSTLFGDIIVETKFCKGCNKDIPVTDFHKHYNGYQQFCKKCRNVGGNRHCNEAKVLMKERGVERPRLGLPCNICGDKTRLLVYDHDHKTKEFRGWLCDPCNLLMGRMGDDTNKIKQKVKKLLKYLEG